MYDSDFLYSPEEDPIGPTPGNDDPQIGLDSPLDVSGLFNERGFYKSNGFNFNDEEIINDFSGNLMYNIPLYNYKLAGDLFFDMKLVYNGSVSHSIKIGDATTQQTGVRNTFNMNMPEWILSVNGVCIQAFNFITKYFSRPTENATNLEGYDINMQIPGYHYTNDWRNRFSTNSDTITLLMGDGSTVTIENEINSSNPEDRYKGNYKGKGKENYIKAIVSYLPGSDPFEYRTRKIVLLKGDGLEYIFNETKNEFIDFTEQGSTDKKPMMPLLMEINNRFGYGIKFNYTSEYNAGSGRPMISSIRTSGISSKQPDLNFDFTFGPRIFLIGHQTNLNEGYEVKFENEGVNYHHSNNGNKIGRVVQIKNCLNQTFEVEYQTSENDKYYERKYLYAFDPFLNANTLNINFNKLKRIRKIKNFLDLRRSYNYIGELVSQIDVQFLYYENPLHIISPMPIFKGYGRDPFFTNMIQDRDEFYIDNGINSKNVISYNYVYDYSHRDLRITPINENDDLITNKTITSLDNSNNNSSITTIEKKLKYKIYPLYDPNNHFAYSPDIDGSTKLIEEKTDYTSNSIVNSMEYEIGIFDPVAKGYNGSFLMKKKIESFNEILRQWEWEYVHKENLVDKFIIESREKDPFGETKIKKFKDFSIEFSRLLYTNIFTPTDLPQSFFYFSYNMVEEEYTELLSSPGIKNNYKKYYFLEATNDIRGYIGQVIKEELYDNINTNKITTNYLYCKYDRTGESIFQASNYFPFKEGNLKEVIKPNGQITKYFYHPISPDEVVIGAIDEPDDLPFLKFLVKYNNNSIVEKSDKIWDHRFPIRTDNVKRIGSNDSILLTSYKSYSSDGSPEKNIEYQKFVTEFDYMLIHRIKKITLPGDFSTIPDEIVITTIHNYTPVEKIITSFQWGSFRYYQNLYFGAYTENIKDINNYSDCRPFIARYSASDSENLQAFMGFDKNEFKNITQLERAQLKIRPINYDMKVNGVPVTDKKIAIKPINRLVKRANSSIFCSPNSLTEYFADLTNFTKQFPLIINNYSTCVFSNDVSLDIIDMLLHSSINNIDFLGIVIYPVFPNIIPSDPTDPEEFVDPIDPEDSSNPFYAQLLMTNCPGFGNITNENNWLQYFSPRIDLKGTIDYLFNIPHTIFKSGTIGYDYDDYNKEINIYSIRNTVSFDSSRTRYLLDAYGNIKRKDIILEETVPEPIYNSYGSEFNFLNKLSKSVDAAGNETKFSYDGLQRLIRTDNQDGSFTKTTFSYLASITSYYFGNVPGAFIEKQIFTDENGNNFEKYYDALGNLRREVKFLSSIVPVEEGEEEPIGEGDTPPIQLITDYLYDSLNRLIKVKTPEGKIIEYQYDGYNRQNKRITVDSGIIQFQYDSNNNLVTSQDANQSAIANYIFTFRKYDALNRLTVLGENSLDRGDFIDFNTDEDFDFTDGDNPDPYFDYFIVNVYDDLSTASANIFTPPADYLPNSQNYNYNTKGRLVATAFRTRKTDPWNFKYFKYDERGRVVTMWQILDGLPIKKIEYNYNSQDQIINYTVIVDANESKRFRYDYDKSGRMKNLLLYTGPEVDNPLDYINLAQYSYNSNSLVSLLGLNDNNLKNDYTYNDRNWIQNCISQEAILAYNMFYYPNGNVQSLNYNGNYNNTFFPYNDLEFEFSYDKSNRLISANCSNFLNKAFDLDNTYDKDGNILTLKRYRGDGIIEDDFNYTYYSNSNKLKKVSNIYEDFGYDNNGNLKSDDMNKNIEIKYDHRNLISLIKHRIFGIEGEFYTIAIYYYYDEAGNRIRKVILQSYINKIEVADSPGDITNYPEYDEETFEKEAKEYSGGEMDSPTTWFLVSNEYYLRGIDGKELANFNGSNIDKFNIWGRDNEGYIDSQNNKYYYLKDHLGSVRVVLDENNNIISAQDYDMWGSLMTGRSFESNKSKYKFTGKERDKESNYDYFGARYYDARIGRWGVEEPLIDKYPQVSSYLYSKNNPISRLDGNGMDDYYYLSGNSMSKNGYVNTGSNNNRYFVQNDSGNYTYEGKNYFQANSYKTIESHESNVRYNKIDVNFQSDNFEKAFNDSLPANSINRTSLQIVPGAKEHYMSVESLRGKMDQKTRTISDQSSLYIFNNIAFNRNEAGNIVWGAVMAFLGFSFEETIAYAQAYTNISQGRSDEKEELKAIKEGWRYQNAK